MNLSKSQLKVFRKNVHNLPDSHYQILSLKRKNRPEIADRIENYKVERAKRTNFIEEIIHDHDIVSDIKNAINAEILFSIYEKNLKKFDELDTTNKNEISWRCCYADVDKDSKKLHKRLLKGLMHITAELTCVFLCFLGDVVIFEPLAIFIEVEGKWEFGKLYEQIKGIYRERPMEAWLILAAFFVLTMIFLILTHHHIPRLFFAEESDRKDCLMALQEKISGKYGEKPLELEEISKLYYSCVIKSGDRADFKEFIQKIEELKLDGKNILDAYKVLNDFLWKPKEQSANILINEVVEIDKKVLAAG